MRNTKRKSDDDAEQGGASVSMHAEPLTYEDARMLQDFYVRGGAKRPVNAGGYTGRQLRGWREDGLIDTIDGVRGGIHAALTVRGLSRLPDALQIIAASPGMAR